MDKNIMVQALNFLDKIVETDLKLLLGGGAALVLAYQFPLSTLDMDALIYKSQITEADIHKEILEVAEKLSLPKDWLNPYFGTFLYTLPKDYEARLKTVFQGKHITVNALGADDLFILKCFAGRDKDRPHARALLKQNLDIDFIQNHLRALIDQNMPHAQEAYDFFDELLDEIS